MISIGKKRLKPVVALWIGFLAVLFLAFLLVVMPQERAKGRIARQLDEKRRATIDARGAASVKIRTRLEQEIETLQRMVGDFVTDHTGATNLAFEVSRISKDMKLNAFSLTNTAKEGFAEVSGCTEILAKPVNVSFSTKFNTFAAFLNTLERHRPAIFTDTFRIVRVPGDAKNHQVDMKLFVLVPNHTKKQNSGIRTAKLETK